MPCQFPRVQRTFLVSWNRQLQEGGLRKPIWVSPTRQKPCGSNEGNGAASLQRQVDRGPDDQRADVQEVGCDRASAESWARVCG